MKNLVSKNKVKSKNRTPEILYKLIDDLENILIKMYLFYCYSYL